MTQQALVNNKWDEIFNYDKDLGVLLWKTNKPKRPAGSQAGNIKSDGRYITMHATINGLKNRYYAHRIIWEMHYGEIKKPMCIDHIDGNGLNNKIDNLRIATLSENQRNRKIGKSNKTGIHGLIIHSGGFSVYCAQKYISYHKDFFEACCSRKSQESKMNFGKSNGILSCK